MSILVYDLAHARAGDKGNTSSIAVIAYDDDGWQVLRQALTAERVEQAFSHLGAGTVRRYEEAERIVNCRDCVTTLHSMVSIIIQRRDRHVMVIPSLY